jgi:hypothetical protein
MEEDYALEDVINKLENNGYITLTNGQNTISIQSVDDKEGYSYITDRHRQFANSRDAVKWSVSELKEIKNVDES